MSAEPSRELNRTPPSAALQPTRYSKHAPAVLMLAASSTEALIPLAVAVSVGSSDVMLFGALTSVGLTLGAAGLLATIYRDALRWSYIRSRVFWQQHIRQRHFGLSVLGRFEYPAFVLASTQIGVARASVIWGVYPMLYVVLLDRSTRTPGGSSRYRRLALRDLAILGVAFLGLVLTVSSQQPSVAAGADANWGTVLGIALAGSSALCAALNSYNISWGINLAASVPVQPRSLDGSDPVAEERLEAAAAMLGVLLAAAVTAPVLVLLAAVVGDFEASGAAIAGSLFIGVFLLTPPVLFVRLANLRTHNLGVNSISYLTPVFSLAVLAVFDQLGDIRTDLLVIGVAAITAANLALNLKTRFPH